jgi:hypothetical protein
MKKILLHYIDNALEVNVRDHCTQPFIFLKEALNKIGYSLELTAQQSLSDVEWVFFINFENVFPYHGIRAKWRLLKDLISDNKKRELYKELKKRGELNKAIMFLWEGPTVSALSYNETFLRRFKQVFSWHDGLVSKYNFYKFYLPVPSDIGVTGLMDFNNRNLLTAISWNKNSGAKNEMYQFRKIEMMALADLLGKMFKFYGQDWDKLEGDERRLLDNYGGPVADKVEVLPKYRFCLCYENVFGLPGYITEKIFDIMRCGVVPIYKGASNIKDYIPKNCFIDRDNFKSSTDLTDYLKSINESQFNDYLNNINQYLKSDDFKYFLPESFATNIIDRLHSISKESCD